MIYKTTETYEANLFRVFGYPYNGCQKITRQNGKEAIEFEFDVPTQDTVQAIVKDYFNHNLQIDAYEHDEAIKFIRKEIYENK